MLRWKLLSVSEVASASCLKPRCQGHCAGSRLCQARLWRPRYGPRLRVATASRVGNQSVDFAVACLAPSVTCLSWNARDCQNKKKRRTSALLRYVSLSQVSDEEQLDRYTLFVTDRYQSTDALTQGQLEHPRLFHFGKRKRAQLVLNAAPIVGHQRVRNA